MELDRELGMKLDMKRVRSLLKLVSTCYGA